MLCVLLLGSGACRPYRSQCVHSADSGTLIAVAITHVRGAADPGLPPRLRLPPNRGDNFSCILKLPAWNFEQHTEVPSLPKSVETLMKNLPLLCEVVDGRETAPFRKSRTNYVAVTRALPAVHSEENRFVVGYAAAVLNGVELSA